MAGQMLLALSILISLHELGHFLAARAFGIKVEKFYLFFDAWGVKLFSIKKGDTEYGIGWLPLGGYVKITGMIDESLDTEALKSEPKPYEFRSKPAWQRLIVMLAGVTVNLFLGLIIFGFSTYYYGISYLPNKEVKYGIATSAFAQEIGFKDGDQLVAVNGKPIERFEDATSLEIYSQASVVYTVLRNGSEINIALPEEFLNKLSSGARKSFIDVRRKFTVGDVRKKDAAETAGVLKGDKIVAINDTAIEYFHELRASLERNANSTVKLTIQRGAEIKTLFAEIDKSGLLGFSPEMEKLNYETEYLSFGNSFALGTKNGLDLLVLNIKGFGSVISGKVDPTKSLMGPIQLAGVFGSTWEWQRFWSLTAMLSLVLAFMNVLPIPALDGGHAMFLTFELISGRPLSDKFMQVAQVIGMVILLSLMVFVIGNDLWSTLF